MNSLVVQADGRIVVGGKFTAIGSVPRTRIGRLNADGTLDSKFDPGSDGDVYALAMQTDGKIVVSGGFTTLGGQLRSRLARLNPDGTVDSGFSPGANDFVMALAMQMDGKIVIGGYFTNLAGLPRSRLARLNPDGTVDLGFNPVANGPVHSIAVQADGKILAGGSFSSLGGQTRNRLGRLNANGTVDTGFNPGANDSVYSLGVQADGKVLVGGFFSILAGQPRGKLGRLNASGTVDTGFNPGANSGVWSLAVQADGKILVGGYFTNLAGQPRRSLGRLHADGTLDSGFDSEADDGVREVAVQADGRILLCGSFTNLAGQTRMYLGRLNNTGPTIQNLSYSGTTINWLRSGTGPEFWYTTFEQSTNGLTWSSLGSGTRVSGGWRLSAVALPADVWIRARGHVMSGGSAWFVETHTYEGPVLLLAQPASRTNNYGTAAALSVSASGTQPLSFQWFKDGVPLEDGGKYCDTMTASLTVSNVLRSDAGSYFVVVSNAYGSVTSAVATLTVREPAFSVQPASQNAEPGQSVTFSTTAAGTEPLSYQWWKDGVMLLNGNDPSLALTNVQSADAGNYTLVVSNMYGSATSRVALLSVNLTTLESGFNPGADSSVGCLAVQADGRILVGGYFTQLAGEPRTQLARLNADGTLDRGFNPGMEINADVWTLGVQTDGRILLGGWFTTLAGQPRDCLGRLNADGSVDSAFNPGANNCVAALLVQADGKVLVGGFFTQLAGEPRTYLARLIADGTLDRGFNPKINTVVWALGVQPDGKILLGGQFTTLADQPHRYLGRLNADGTVDSSFSPGANNYVAALLVQADGKILVAGRFTELGGHPRNYLGRLNADGTVDLGFNPGANKDVWALALQADRKILLAGRFTELGGHPRNYLGRLNADGTVDSSFNPGANKDVLALAVQKDGKVLAGGNFSSLAGQGCLYLGRVNNTEPATDSLSFDGSTITWLRGGTGPEAWLATFEESTDGRVWSSLGSVTRTTGGWTLGGLALTPNSTIRARGHVTGGLGNSSIWFVESLLPLTRPVLAVQEVHGSLQTYLLSGHVGVRYTVETATSLGSPANWSPVYSLTLSNSVQPFGWTNVGEGSRFFRARSD